MKSRLPPRKKPYKGYNLPSATYLAKDGSKFKVEAPATTELYDSFIIENVKVTFVLPEGVENVKIQADFDFARSEDSTRYSKLDKWAVNLATFLRRLWRDLKATFVWSLLQTDILSLCMSFWSIYTVKCHYSDTPVSELTILTE